MPTWDHGPMTACRLIRPADAAALTALVRANREFLAPWEPLREEHYFTEAGQRADIEQALERHKIGNALPCVIVDDEGAVVGRITLNGIVRGAFQSCSVGYWLSAAASGRGLATAALRDIKTTAFGELGLHRIQAETLLHNVPSQRVLERNGFSRIGLAPTYLKIAGRWQDCVLYQVINDDATDSGDNPHEGPAFSIASMEAFQLG
jgi:ribosomal-protein-alanine N-acetyltransferase